jgi:hypothetical protein
VKTILALCALALVLIGVFVWNATRMPNEFGAREGAPKVAVAALLEKPTDYLTKTVAIEGTITDQCETMGCYFYFESGKHRLRVDLADIAMDAPMGKNGHRAEVEGRMVPFNDGHQFWASWVLFK